MKIVGCTRRRGLSALEMVLCLPILLFVMALMINFGTAACWKVRSLSAARHAVWATRRPRTGDGNPRPSCWPASAGMEADGAGGLPALDDPRVDRPVARGPLPHGAEVNGKLLDPGRGLRRGTADISRTFPLLKRLGEYRLAAEHTLLNDTWKFKHMGLWHNWDRRMTILYTLPQADPELVDAYIQAAINILYASFRENLRPLDDDDEFVGYAMRFGWADEPPDFHPRLQQFCGLSHATADLRVEDLIDRIQGKVERDADGNVVRRVPSVAEDMARAFIDLYRRVIRQLDGSGNQAEIAQLQADIDTLTQFLGGL